MDQEQTVITDGLFVSRSDRSCFGTATKRLSFAHNGKQVVSENGWSVTTGKHLNMIDGGDKKSRLPRGKFEDALNAVLTELNLQ